MFAVLNENNVLVGYSEEKTPNCVEVPADCDLKTNGLYQFDKDAGAFVPLETPIEEDVLEPNTIKAIAAGFTYLRSKKGFDFPKVTLDWLEWYSKSVDGSI